MTGAYGPLEFKAALRVSRETMARLEVFQEVLADWSKRMNLIGPNELGLFWSRHALDSAQVFKLAPEARRWVDLGSGAGFPGLIIACFLVDEAPYGSWIHLVEATEKKCAFLRAAIERAELPAKVFNTRIEDFGVGEGPYDVVTARALAPLPRLMSYAKPILDRGAQGLFHKGSNLEAELADARNALGGASGPDRIGPYRADVLESLSDPRGRILRVSKAV